MKTSFYNGKKVLVTGGTGFVARHLIEALLKAGAVVRTVGRRPRPHGLDPDVAYLQLDLTDKASALKATAKVDVVFHLASVGWGFHENLKRQAQVLTQNLLLNSMVIDAAYESGVSRYLFTSSVGVYPAESREMKESNPLEKPPHASEQYYAWSKRMGEIQARAFYQNYKFPVAIVRPSNPYGPYDNFDPEKSHVIPSLIRRALSGEDPFVVWGTGKPVRSFVFAPDVATGMMTAMEKISDGTPVNLSGAETTSIRELSELVLTACGRHPSEIVFDTSKPDGHPHRVPSVERARELLNMDAYTPLEKGLKKTVEWYVGGQASS